VSLEYHGTLCWLSSDLETPEHSTDGQWTAGQWTAVVVSGQQSVVSGRRLAVSGRWSVVGGQWSAVGGRRSVECILQSQSYGTSPAVWDHTVLPATLSKWTCPALTPARKAGTWFTYMDGWKAELTLAAGYTPRWFTRLHMVTHPSTNRARRRVTTLKEPEKFFMGMPSQNYVDRDQHNTTMPRHQCRWIVSYFHQ